MHTNFCVRTGQLTVRGLRGTRSHTFQQWISLKGNSELRV